MTNVDCQLDTHPWEEGSSVKELLPSDGPVGLSWFYFSVAVGGGAASCELYHA